MRNFAVLTMLGFVLSTAPAFAETMDAMFGNTVTVTQPNGAVDRYYFEPDGAFVERSHDGATYAGRWARRAGDVCLTVDQREDCEAIPVDKSVGDAWTLETGGGSIAIAIVRGRA
ncbi:MAG TPA: hypothetical protein VG943_11995 [Caulobacterales bacterium]|nr:hypothetical protein [Caulobacterales bacterium]